MATASFPASSRTEAGKGTARKLRAAGAIPAVIYGHKREPQSLKLDAHTFNRMLEKISYLTTVIELNIDGKVSKTIIRELHISVDPSEIPNHIDIDVTSLAVGKSLHVSDVVAPKGVTILDDAGQTVCVCMIPKEEAVPTPEEAAAAAAVPAEPELIRKVKPEEGEEGAEAAPEPEKK